MNKPARTLLLLVVVVFAGVALLSALSTNSPLAIGPQPKELRQDELFTALARKEID